MNVFNTILITIVFAVSLYVAFLVLGVGGINQNRKAQGLDKRSNIDIQTDK